MSAAASWPVAIPIATPRLRLEPLRVEHAKEAVSVFNDDRLHVWTGGSPCTYEELEDRYRRQSAGQSADGTRGWLNWMLRWLADERLVGTVQATLYRPAPDRLEGELAWVVGTDYQGHGYGREGALAMAHWLRAQGVDSLVAYICPGHHASIRIAQALGLTATDIVSDGGEVCWSDRRP